MASSPTGPHPHFFIPYFTPFFLTIFLALPFAGPPAASALNVTSLLSGHPDLSSFSDLLSSSTVAGDFSGRSSLTLLAVPNSFLRRSDAFRFSAGDIADILRYHVLLEYLSWPDLHRIPISGRLVTTLFQTTGRAPNNLGSVNLTRDPLSGTITVRSPAPYFPSNATVISQVMNLPYNISVFAVNDLLMPYGFDLAASETRPQPALNITRVLLDGKNFNVAASMMEASGVVEELEKKESGAGITFFVPTDEAFAGLPATERLQSLPAEKKSVVLKFHVLHSYYPLGSLESIVNPLQPTFATEDTGAGSFTLNITRVNGSVAIDTGVVLATITRTVYDQNPVAVFAVSKVLLPRQVFGKGAEAQQQGGALRTAAPPMEEVSVPPAMLMSPETVSNVGTSSGFRNWGICVGLIFLLVPLLGGGDLGI